LAAAAGIAQAGLSGGLNAVAGAVFVVIGSLSVNGPVLYFMLAPARAAAPLASIKEFMSDHNAVIMMVILLVLGLKLLGAGIGGLGRYRSPRGRVDTADICPHLNERVTAPPAAHELSLNIWAK